MDSDREDSTTSLCSLGDDNLSSDNSIIVSFTRLVGKCVSYRFDTKLVTRVTFDRSKMIQIEKSHFFTSLLCSVALPASQAIAHSII